MPTTTANYLANRILYPYAVPENKKELSLDLELVQAILKKNYSRYQDSARKRIFIEEEWFERYPDMEALGELLIKTLKPKDIATIFIKKGSKSVGVIVVPKIQDPRKNMIFTIGEERRAVKAGHIVVIPTYNRTTAVRFESQGATLLGKKEIGLEVASGPMGLIIDARGETE